MRNIPLCVPLQILNTVYGLVIVWFDEAWAWVKVWASSSTLPFITWLNQIHRTSLPIAITGLLNYGDYFGSLGKMDVKKYW